MTNEEFEQDSDEEVSPPLEETHLTILHCVGLVVALFFLMALAGLIISRIPGPSFEETGWINSAISRTVSGLLTAEAGAILAGLSLAALVSSGRINAAILGSVVIAVLGVIIVTSELGNFLQSIKSLPQFYLDLIEKLDQQSLPGVLLAVGIVAPVTEELIFRGVMLEGLRERYPLSTAIFVSTTLFAMVHVLPWLVINAFLIGAFLAWLKLETRSLLVCMVAHALYNSLPFVLTRVFSVDIQGFTTTPADTIVFQPLWFDLLGAAFLLLGIGGIRYFSRPPEIETLDRFVEMPQQGGPAQE